MHTFWNCFWDPQTTVFQAPLPQSLGGRQNARGTHVLLQFQAAVVIFLGGMEQILMTSMLHVAEYELLRVRFVVDAWIDWAIPAVLRCLEAPRYLEAPWPANISRISRSHHQDHPKKNHRNFHPTSFSQEFPKQLWLPRIFFPFFQVSFNPTQAGPDPAGPRNRPGNVLWRSEDLWLHGWAWWVTVQ